MRVYPRLMTAVVLAAVSLASSFSLAAEKKPAANVSNDKPAAPPTRFAFVLNNGYGEGDKFPTDPKVFENLLINMKKAGFNTIYCVYTDWRLELCKKHDIQMMIDVLAWHKGAETDIRRKEQRDTVKAICEKVRGNDAVWGYNIWNEKLAWFGNPEGRSIDDYIRMLKQWDPTHPVWMGTYQVNYANAPKSKPGVHAYYDYHWQRGFIWHYADLRWYSNYVPGQDGYIGRWMLGSNYNWNSYTLNTSLAFGLKVVIWFIGGPFDEQGNINPKHRFYHLVRVGQEHQALYKDLMEIGRPVAVYSTPTTKDQSNKPKETNVPWGLTAFPADHWLQVQKGEALLGFFQYPNGDDAIYVANHNAYAPQEMVLELKPKDTLTVELLDRKTGQWRELSVKNATVSFPLETAGGELLRVKGRKK